ncbi:MAG: threonine-phosphate decarboxylase [Deltaproteobacteria bacterium]|nr:threonine-phosphate decarboxylase [Deltaproteobacteria bacterium]
MITGHGGNIYELARRLGCAPADIVDMSSNVNPLGPMAGLVRELETRLSVITALPEAGAEGIIGNFAEYYGVDSRCVAAGNGTTQLIHTLPVALNSRNVLIVGPTYADYADACRMFGVNHDSLLADETTRFRADIPAVAHKAKAFDTVFICNPNNPTGSLIPAADLIWLSSRLPATVFIIDESYMPFVGSEAADSVIARGLPNVIVLHSLSKIFRIPGLRIGFLVGPENITAHIGRYRLPWNVNSLAHVAVEYLMTQRERVGDFIRETRAFLVVEKRHLEVGLSKVPGMTVFPTETSFVLIKLPEAVGAESVCERLSRHKILIRNCANFVGLDDRFIRVSLKTRECNQMVIDHLIALCKPSFALSDQPAHGKTA